MQNKQQLSLKAIQYNGFIILEKIILTFAQFPCYFHESIVSNRVKWKKRIHIANPTNLELRLSCYCSLNPLLFPFYMNPLFQLLNH